MKPWFASLWLRLLGSFQPESPRSASVYPLAAGIAYDAAPGFGVTLSLTGGKASGVGNDPDAGAAISQPRKDNE